MIVCIAGIRPTSVLVRFSQFKPVSYLNRQAFDFPEAGKETGITQAQVAAVFPDGQLKLARSVAVKRLQDLAGHNVKRRSAMRPSGPMANLLSTAASKMGE